eukprot:scaffold1320_cov253-Pinguiococcus_pyrenoidosus.AAC.17
MAAWQRYFPGRRLRARQGFGGVGVGPVWKALCSGSQKPACNVAPPNRLSREYSYTPLKNTFLCASGTSPWRHDASELGLGRSLEEVLLVIARVLALVVERVSKRLPDLQQGIFQVHGLQALLAAFHRVLIRVLGEARLQLLGPRQNALYHPEATVRQPGRDGRSKDSGTPARPENEHVLRCERHGEGNGREGHRDCREEARDRETPRQPWEVVRQELPEAAPDEHAGQDLTADESKAERKAKQEDLGQQGVPKLPSSVLVDPVREEGLDLNEAVAEGEGQSLADQADHRARHQVQKQAGEPVWQPSGDKAAQYPIVELLCGADPGHRDQPHQASHDPQAEAAHEKVGLPLKLLRISILQLLDVFRVVRAAQKPVVDDEGGRCRKSHQSNLFHPVVAGRRAWRLGEGPRGKKAAVRLRRGIHARLTALDRSRGRQERLWRGAEAAGRGGPARFGPDGAAGDVGDHIQLVDHHDRYHRRGQDGAHRCRHADEQRDAAAILHVRATATEDHANRSS